MSKYKEALVQQLHENGEPEETIEGVDGTWYELYRLEHDDLCGAILYSDSEGGVSGTFFEDEEELSVAWEELGEEDDDEGDEEGED